MQEEYQEVHHQTHFEYSFVGSWNIQLLNELRESELSIHLKHANCRHESPLVEVQLPPEYLTEWDERNSVNVESGAFEVGGGDEFGVVHFVAIHLLSDILVRLCVWIHLLINGLSLATGAVLLGVDGVVGSSELDQDV